MIKMDVADDMSCTAAAVAYVIGPENFARIV